MERTYHNTVHLWFGIALTMILVIGDWIAKAAALAHLTEQKIPIFNNVIDLVLHKNYGVVSNAPVPLAIVLPLTVVIVIACAGWLTRTWHKHHKLSLALILLIGGAIGNFADRVINGFTTDYLLLVNRSVINVADILIILGVLGILFYTNNTSPSKK